MVQNRTGIMDLQNKSNILVAKQWKIRNSVPMSYIICKKDLKSTRRGGQMVIFLVPPGFYGFHRGPTGVPGGPTRVPPGCSGDGLASAGEGLGGIW